MRKKLIIKEFLIIPVILVILILFVSGLHIFIHGRVSEVFFPTTHTIFSTVRMFFTALLLLIFLEYFISFEVPNNLLFARMISLLVMFGIIIGLSYYYYSKFTVYNEFVFLYMYFLSIYPAQIVSYNLQRINRIRYNTLAGVIIIALTSFTITYLTLTNTIY